MVLYLTFMHTYEIRYLIDDFTGNEFNQIGYFCNIFNLIIACINDFQLHLKIGTEKPILHNEVKCFKKRSILAG